MSSEDSNDALDLDLYRSLNKPTSSNDFIDEALSELRPDGCAEDDGDNDNNNGGDNEVPDEMIKQIKEESLTMSTVVEILKEENDIQELRDQISSLEDYENDNEMHLPEEEDSIQEDEPEEEESLVSEAEHDEHFYEPMKEFESDEEEPYEEPVDEQMVEDEPEEGSSTGDSKKRKRDDYDSQQLPCFFNPYVYEILPNCLKRICSLFDKPHEKDLYLTGALPVLATCMPNVELIYGCQRQGPNLYTCVVASSGEGKHTFTHAKLLLEDVKKYAYDQSIKERDAMRELKRKDKTFKDHPLPPFKLIVLPGNSSASALVNCMMHNKGRGIIYESEISSMSKVLNTEWGDNRDVLMKAFHGEEVSKLRLSDNEMVTIESPTLSIAVSGTASSFIKLLGDKEDGLFSRFCFYTFKDKPVYVSQVNAEKDKKLLLYSSQLSWTLKNLYIKLDERTTPLIFTMSQDHIDKMDNAFKEAMEKIVEEELVDMYSTLKRMACACYKICAVISMIRLMDEGKTPNATDTHYTCTEDDLEVAILLSGGYLNHAVALSKRMPEDKKQKVLKPMKLCIDQYIKFTGNKKILFENMPHKFETKDALLKGEELKISERSVERYIGEWKKMKIIKTDNHGHHEKTI